MQPQAYLALRSCRTTQAAAAAAARSAAGVAFPFWSVLHFCWRPLFYIGVDHHWIGSATTAQLPRWLPDGRPTVGRRLVGAVTEGVRCFQIRSLFETRLDGAATGQALVTMAGGPGIPGNCSCPASAGCRCPADVRGLPLCSHMCALVRMPRHPARPPQSQGQNPSAAHCVTCRRQALVRPPPAAAAARPAPRT